jgi:diamine N-acetyltransferase
LIAVIVTLRAISNDNREAVLALRVAAEQERFVGSVRGALDDAAEYPHANPWYRAVYASDEPVGFVMVSWNVQPRLPDIIGPWFLWKMIIDWRYQRRGYGAEAVRQVAELIRTEGATELLISYLPEEGGPAGFYQRLGFVPTGEFDGAGEPIVRLALPGTDSASPSVGMS